VGHGCDMMAKNRLVFHEKGEMLVDLSRELPEDAIECVEQKNVNGGFGMMLAIRPELLPEKNAKMFYIRSNMWIYPVCGPAKLPQWIADMSLDIKNHSSGLRGITPEVIPFSFHASLPASDHFAITFTPDESRIRNSIRLDGFRWYPRVQEPYLLTLPDISGEFDHAIGYLGSEGPAVLWRESIDFK